MSKLLLLYATLLVGLIFLIIPNYDTPMDFFLFSDMKLSGAMHIYFIGEKAILIILAYIIANEATEYERPLWIFFYLICADLVDYLLSYNAVWFYINSFPISMNIVKSIVFGIVILQTWIKTLLK